MLGEAVEAGWGPEVTEGQGIARLVTQVLWRQMIQGVLMMGSSSLKMTTGTERQGVQQVSPTGLTLRAAEGCFIKNSLHMNWISPMTMHFYTHDIVYC